MANKYLIRLDDACPTMNGVNWKRIESLLDDYGIRPLVGIVPHNEDENLQVDASDSMFWNKALAWQQKGWTIALHGYNHCYISQGGLSGLNPMWQRSEFAGVPLSVQQQKIREGVQILKSHGLAPHYFFAPSHTFDHNTLKALQVESDIRMISDTIAFYPYREGDFLYVPQITGRCVKMFIGGCYTFCFHPNTMNESSFKALEAFLNRHAHEFTDFATISHGKYAERTFADKLLARFFFVRRQLCGLK